ncbi:MAG: hypothetical protein ABI425_03075 [Patescibacteria group bacterium]
MFFSTLLADISNPVLQPNYGGGTADKAAAFTNYIVLLWRTLIIVGGLATLLFLIWGAVDWILAGGEEAKIAGARKKMTGAVIGLALLAASVAIIELVGSLIGLDLLKICFPGPNGTCQ